VIYFQREDAPNGDNIGFIRLFRFEFEAASDKIPA
jgi:hypothetical protein